MGRHAPRTSSNAARVAAAVGLLGLVLALSGTPAGAHPLGNFTTNTSAAIRVRPDEVLIDYVIDLAEIPTLQARPSIDTNDDDELQGDERSSYATATCEAAAGGLEVTVDDREAALELVDTAISFPEGQAGLVTSRLECALRRPARVGGARATVRFSDSNYSDKLGWREAIVLGDRTTIVESDVRSKSISRRLIEYPEGRLASPLRELEATVVVAPGGPAASPEEATSDRPLVSADRLTSLVSERRLTVPFGLFAVAVSFVLGAFHALAPGHGKTVMAAYLVGEQGSRRQALLLGATVALTHTGGVFALALVVSNSSLAPERLYPLLGTLSGLLVLGIGIVLLRRALQFRRLFPTLGPGARHHHHGFGGHTHSHDDDHDHPHADDHSHDGHEHRHADDHSHDGHEHRHADDHSHDGHDHDGVPGHEHDHPAGRAHVHAGPEQEHRRDLAPELDHGAERAMIPDPVGGHLHDAGHAPGHDLGPAPDAAPAASQTGPAMKARNMMAMGFAGGLVPSPSALVVLLGSIAIGRAWFGFVLIVAYGAGLAAVLVGAGLLLERLRHRIQPLLARHSRPRLALLASNLPLVTSVLVIAGGLYLIARAVSEA